MNKEELVERVNGLPLFEKRQIKNETAPGSAEWKLDEKNNSIVEVGGQKVVTYVGKRYHLLQYKEVFLPILDNIDSDVEGWLIHFDGFASLVMFPHLDELKDKHSKYGIMAQNSVDCSSAVIVKFCVEHKGRRIIIPPKVAGLKKMHTGKVEGLVKNYMGMIGPVKEVWGNIVNEFPNYNVVIEAKEGDEADEHEVEFGFICEQLKIGERIQKELKEKQQKAIGNGLTYSVWDVFVDSVDILSDKKYKSDVHQQRRLDKLSKEVFRFATVLSI